MLKNWKIVKNLQNCWKNYDFLNVEDYIKKKNHVKFVKRLAKTYWNRKMWHHKSSKTWKVMKIDKF